MQTNLDSLPPELLDRFRKLEEMVTAPETETERAGKLDAELRANRDRAAEAEDSLQHKIRRAKAEIYEEDRMIKILSDGTTEDGRMPLTYQKAPATITDPNNGDLTPMSASIPEQKG